MNELKHFNPLAMIEPKTAADRLLILRELNAEINNLIEAFSAITADCGERSPETAC